MNSVHSKIFHVKNGVRQGAILSPTLFCIYLDTLLSDLRKSGIGCYIGHEFMGAFGYADDVILLAPTRHALQIMLKICENFASTHSMQFSTDPRPQKSKTKCLYLTEKQEKPEPEKVILNNDPLPWVKNAQHLGNQLNTNINIAIHCPDTSQDLLMKRGIFYDKIYSLKQEFGHLHPKIVSDLLRIYGTSFYGSLIWSLKSKECQKLIRSWNVAIKIIWDLPYQTHTMFIEALTNYPHLQSILHSRYVGFAETLSKSKKFHVKMLFENCKHDLRTITGTNLQYLQQNYDCLTLLDLFSKRYEISNSIVNEMKEEDVWNVELLEDLINVKYGGENELDFSEDEITELIEFVAVS